MFRIVFAVLVALMVACGADGSASPTKQPEAGTDVTDADPLGELGDSCEGVVVDAAACPALSEIVVHAGLDPTAIQSGPLPTTTKKVAVGCFPDGLGDPRCTFRCEFMSEASQHAGVPGAKALCEALGGECKDLAGTGGLRQCWL